MVKDLQRAIESDSGSENDYDSVVGSSYLPASQHPLMIVNQLPPVQRKIAAALKSEILMKSLMSC